MQLSEPHGKNWVDVYRSASNASRKVAAGEKKPYSLKSVNDANGGDGDGDMPLRLPRPSTTGHGAGRGRCVVRRSYHLPKEYSFRSQQGVPAVLLQTAEPQGKVGPAVEKS